MALIKHSLGNKDDTSTCNVDDISKESNISYHPIVVIIRAESEI